MNFAYIDGMSLLDQILRPPPDPVPAVPWEPDAEWLEFELELGRFKAKYTKERIETQKALAELNERKEETSILNMMIDNVKSPVLKASLESLLNKNETDEGTPALAQQCGEGLGKLEGMRKILKETEVERYAKFTCFICQDRLIDLFIDPCGHVVCDTCWIRTRDKDTCPGCRTRITGAKKVFNM